MPRMRVDGCAIVGRLSDHRVRESVAATAQVLRARGIAVFVAADTGSTDLPDEVEAIAESELLHKANLVIAVGGDGTLLRAAQLVAGRDVPLVGINRGRLGFLTDILPQDAAQALETILDGDGLEDVRAMLDVTLRDGTRTLARGMALNDVVLQKAETGRMVDFESRVDGTYVNTHRADGVIVATATGSTAYALSCGGPIVAPTLDVLVLTPICPHTLSDRPIVLPATAQIEIALNERDETRAQIMCDGQVLAEIEPGQTIRVAVAPHAIKLLHPRDYDYYRLLRSKLHWGRGGNHSER
ncbi:MAG: NAD(+) kinase [Steroidobacteraceae bacterium]